MPTSTCSARWRAEAVAAAVQPGHLFGRGLLLIQPRARADRSAARSRCSNCSQGEAAAPRDERRAVDARAAGQQRRGRGLPAQVHVRAAPRGLRVPCLERRPPRRHAPVVREHRLAVGHALRLPARIQRDARAERTREVHPVPGIGAAARADLQAGGLGVLERVDLPVDALVQAPRPARRPQAQHAEAAAALRVGERVGGGPGVHLLVVRPAGEQRQRHLVPRRRIEHDPAERVGEAQEAVVSG